MRPAGGWGHRPAKAAKEVSTDPADAAQAEVTAKLGIGRHSSLAAALAEPVGNYQQATVPRVADVRIAPLIGGDATRGPRGGRVCQRGEMSVAGQRRDAQGCGLAAGNVQVPAHL